MAGQGAKRRANAKRRQEKAAAKKPAKKGAGKEQQDSDTVHLVVPLITEDDLLAFQFAHFGDDTKPEEWFVDAGIAVDYDPWADDEDDDLGHYEDGVKRTLTDEQIEMFRHSEMEGLLREERLRREEGMPVNTASEVQEELREEGRDRPTSPASDASSLEHELLALSRAKPAARDPSTEARQPSLSSRSDLSRQTDPRMRQREEEVPYYQRNKRKWEDYIDENDPIEGSMTHRRLVRELDERQEVSVDLDY